MKRASAHSGAKPGVRWAFMGELNHLWRKIAGVIDGLGSEEGFAGVGSEQLASFFVFNIVFIISFVLNLYGSVDIISHTVSCLHGEEKKQHQVPRRKTCRGGGLQEARGRAIVLNFLCNLLDFFNFCAIL